MNIPATGNTIYAAIANDPAAMATIRAEFRSLALAIATNPAASATITSATINGQSFSSQPAITTGQRLALLRWVVAAIDKGGPISPTLISTF